MIDVQPLLGAIFGAGTVGFITVLVTSWRRLKTGKISDDESIIRRLHRELQLKDASSAQDRAEAERAIRIRNAWREQAYRWRLQLVQNGFEPTPLEVDEDDE